MNVNTGETTLWHEEGKVVSEPVFVSAPDASREDDGVVLSTLVDKVSLWINFYPVEVLCSVCFFQGVYLNTFREYRLMFRILAGKWSLYPYRDADKR